MRVSIVTTTLNALRYIVETTRSVLLTPHSDLEYLVVDAGSTDGTREFLLALQDHRLRVEILEGASQYEAIDWGLRHVTGEVVAWLNGDDLYLPWTITTVSRLFTEFPQVQWMTGLPTYIDGEGDCTMVANQVPTRNDTSATDGFTTMRTAIWCRKACSGAEISISWLAD